MFIYRLALELGEPDIDRILDGLTAAQIIGWMDYFELEPFGYARSDLAHAITTSVIANAHRNKRQSPFKVSDFIPKFGPRKQQTWQEMKAKMKLFAKIHNSRLEEKKHG